ncbi:hypothetical protein EDD19_10640 [Dietzia cinnamea]|uniref:Uncharacterized protein n=1 Tax=Dietzia cinnamea TaxID=321318 RepID=A0A4R3ZVJ9_9ACTN|nr:hypothetical protein EDD19_10640 [Dietzia cinnamea]
MRPVSRPFHHLGEAAARLAAEHAVRGCPVPIECELAGLDALVAELGQVTGDRQPGAVLHQHDRHPPVARGRLRIGLAQQRDEARATGVGDERLGAGDDQLVPVGAGDRRHVLQVGSSARFGERHRRPYLAGRQAREVGPLLFLGPELRQERGHHGVTAHRPGQRHPPAGQLLGDPDVARHGDRHAAVLLRHREPVDTDLLHLLDPALGVGVGVLHLARRRLDLTVDELADRGNEVGLFVVQFRHLSHLVVVTSPRSPRRTSPAAGCGVPPPSSPPAPL